MDRNLGKSNPCPNFNFINSSGQYDYHSARVLRYQPPLENVYRYNPRFRSTARTYETDRECVRRRRILVLLPRKKILNLCRFESLLAKLLRVTTSSVKYELMRQGIDRRSLFRSRRSPRSASSVWRGGDTEITCAVSQWSHVRLESSERGFIARSNPLPNLRPKMASLKGTEQTWTGRNMKADRSGKSDGVALESHSSIRIRRFLPVARQYRGHSRAIEISEVSS